MRARSAGALLAMMLLALAAIAARAEDAPAIPLWAGEIPYAAQSPGQAAPSLAAYEAEGAKIAVVVCPGGSYIKHSSVEGAPVAERLREDGLSAYVLDYRVSPCDPMAPLTDARRAIRAVRAMGYERVGILGFSAGGHLACCAAVHWDAGDPAAEDPIDRLTSRPDFLVACYSVVSFSAYPELQSVESLLGGLAGDAKWMDYFSVERHVDADTPPAFIWHSATDGRVSVGNSLLLAQAMTDAGVPYELHVYPTGKHGIGLAKKYPGVRSWPKECVSFIKRICGGD